MFELDQTKSWVETSPERVIYLATSVNRPVVAPPEGSPEAAQSYICITKETQGFYVYIYLHLLSSNVGLLYRWDEGAVQRDMVANLQQNAIEFTESMGFMMSDLRYRELDQAGKKELFENTPLFFKDLSKFRTSEPEEIASVEPEELIIEPVKEEEETVTTGDFVLESDAFVEEPVAESEVLLEPETVQAPEPSPIPRQPSPPQQPKTPQTTPSQKPVSPPPPPQKATPPPPPPMPEQPSKDVEDMLLDQLEIKEEPPAPEVTPLAPKPAPPSAPPLSEQKPEEEVVIEMIEEEAEVQAGSEVSTSLPQAEVVMEVKEIEEPQSAPQEFPLEPEEEITVEMEAPVAVKPPSPAPPAPLVEQKSPPQPKQAVEPKESVRAPQEGLSEEDEKLIIKLLIMM